MAVSQGLLFKTLLKIVVQRNHIQIQNQLNNEICFRRELHWVEVDRRRHHDGRHIAITSLSRRYHVAIMHDLQLIYS